MAASDIYPAFGQLALNHVRNLAVASAAPTTRPRAEQPRPRCRTKRPPRFGAAAATDVFFGAPRFFAAAAPEVFPGAPRFSAAASLPPDPLAFFLPHCFWSVCYCNLVIGRSFSLCPDTLKPSPPPHLLHICFPPLAAPGHRQDLNPKSLVPKSRRATEMVKVHTLRNVILAQGPTSVCVCVCLCACACALHAHVLRDVRARSSLTAAPRRIRPRSRLVLRLLLRALRRSLLRISARSRLKPRQGRCGLWA